MRQGDLFEKIIGLVIALLGLCLDTITVTSFIGGWFIWKWETLVNIFMTLFYLPLIILGIVFIYFGIRIFKGKE